LTNSALAGPIIEQPQGGPDEYRGYFDIDAAIGFDLDEPTRILKVQMWMAPVEGNDVTAAIEYHLSGFPTPLYSDTFTGKSTHSAPSSWQGLSSLKWDLQPGSYYLTFGPSFFARALPVGERSPGAKAPTDIEFAFAPSFSFFEEPNLPLEWKKTDSPLGVRIYGIPLSAVPEPASYGALGGAMLLALAAFRRRRRTRQMGEQKTSGLDS
jgi:hypothetical protein